MKVEETTKAVALDTISAFVKRFMKQIARIRWNLSPKGYGNTELSREDNSWACVETRWATPLGVMV